MIPQARTDLIVSAAADEVVIYDPVRHSVHHLNRTAALVWRLCDGRTPEPCMPAALERELGTALPEELVWSALEELRRAQLLQEPPPAEPPAAAGELLTRREFARRARLAGALAALAPVVISIAAPTAAQAASCPDGGSGFGAAEIAGVAVPVSAGVLEGVSARRKRVRRRRRARLARERLTALPSCHGLSGTGEVVCLNGPDCPTCGGFVMASGR